MVILSIKKPVNEPKKNQPVQFCQQIIREHLFTIPFLIRTSGLKIVSSGGRVIRLNKDDTFCPGRPRDGLHHRGRLSRLPLDAKQLSS